jgi:hypothetical protein
MGKRHREFAVPLTGEVDLRPDLPGHELDEILQRHLRRGQGRPAGGDIRAHREIQARMRRVGELLKSGGELDVVETDGRDLPRAQVSRLQPHEEVPHEADNQSESEPGEDELAGEFQIARFGLLLRPTPAPPARRIIVRR